MIHARQSKSHWESSEEPSTPRYSAHHKTTPRAAIGDSHEARREENHSEQCEQNARNSDSGLETQLSNWQVFSIWDVRLQQMGSQRVN